MITDYKYTIEQCDVSDKVALAKFREKRRTWLTWLETDEHHAIWQVLSSMVWNDVSFRTIAQLGNTSDSAIHNSLVTEIMLNGHFAVQILAIRRLMDNKGKKVISLPKLLTDLRRNINLFTRENYVACDGLPYDHEAAFQRVMKQRLSQQNTSQVFWGETSGPDAHSTSQHAHEHFDKLTGVLPENRKRDDRLSIEIIDTLERWMIESKAAELADWSHKLLAHAAGPDDSYREAVIAASPTLDKISIAIKFFARVTEAISLHMLFHSGRSHALMPVAQFNQFEKLEFPMMPQNGVQTLRDYWHTLSKERDEYIKGTEEALIQSLSSKA